MGHLDIAAVLSDADHTVHRYHISFVDARCAAAFIKDAKQH